MKKLAAWTLLAIYLNAAAQMLLPFVSDCFAHMFFWHDHLEHVHHGQVHSHHVASEMAALTGDPGDHQYPSAPHPAFAFDKDALSAHLAPEQAVPLVRASQAFIPLNSGWRFLYESVAGEVLFPPPDRAWQ